MLRIVAQGLNKNTIIYLHIKLPLNLEVAYSHHEYPYECCCICHLIQSLSNVPRVHRALRVQGWGNIPQPWALVMGRHYPLGVCICFNKMKLLAVLPQVFQPHVVSEFLLRLYNCSYLRYSCGEERDKHHLGWSELAFKMFLAAKGKKGKATTLPALIRDQFHHSFPSLKCHLAAAIP